MVKHCKGFILFISFLMCIACDAAFVTNGKIIGINSGKFIYENRSLDAVYNVPINKVWEAAEQTLEEMKAVDIQKERKIATGLITATIEEEKITLFLSYMMKERTSLSITAGIAGNRLLSKMINDKISKKLDSDASQ